MVIKAATFFIIPIVLAFAFSYVLENATLIVSIAMPFCKICVYVGQPLIKSDFLTSMNWIFLSPLPAKKNMLVSGSYNGIRILQRSEKTHTTIINEIQLRRKMLLAFLTYPEDMSKLSDFCGCDRLRMSRMISSLERSCISRNVVNQVIIKTFKVWSR